MSGDTLKRLNNPDYPEEFLRLESDNLVITYVSLGGASLDTIYERKQTIPEICTEDAIQIMYFSPVEVIEGVNTEFTVYFDYRLVRSEEAEVYLSFPFDNWGARIIGEPTGGVTAGIGSAIISAETIPIDVENEGEYSLEITMLGSTNVAQNDRVYLDFFPD